VAQATTLTDDILRRLIAVGQVDIVVGVPTLNNAGTIAATLGAAVAGLTEHFPRARTVIISADGGSADGTPEVAHDLASGVSALAGLRTRHVIATSYRGGPLRTGALRLIFTAADLLQARAVVVLDPETASLTPAWIGGLVRPISNQSFDFVAPSYGRHPLEGLLVTQLIRPLIRATYCREVDEPLVGEFGCSGRFAAQCLRDEAWDRSPLRDGIELWLMGTALAEDFRACQVYLGPRATAPATRPRPGLRDAFPRLIGSLFACLDAHATAWLRRTGSEPLPLIGAEPRDIAEAPSIDPTELGRTFVEDVRALQPILQSIVATDTLATISAMTEGSTLEVVRYSDEAWVATVYDFLAAHHEAVMDRAHIAQALMPLYLGRVASFVGEHATSTLADVARALDRLSQEFERAKPNLIERWRSAR
jgi:hypothetical protein